MDLCWFDKLHRDGFTTLPNVLDAATVSRLIESLDHAITNSAAIREKGSRVYAMRNLLALSPAVREVAQSTPVRAIIKPVLGPSARAVRALLFDKTPGANWKVAWHQDLSIAVKQRIDTPGFGPWSQKAGIDHVQPPREILQRMLTIRIHLDDRGEENGPLLVLPGSHAAGVLSPDQLAGWRAKVPPTPCIVAKGGAVVMRPLVLHASSASTSPFHRRVVHLEFAADALPGGLQWHES